MNNIKNYTALDIENPNTRGNSICAMGILVVRDEIIVDRKYSLINPEDRFDRNNIEITGISESMVLNSPTLPEYWPDIKDLLTGSIIVGHNIQYDLSVISKSLDRYCIQIPDFKFIDTLQLSRSYMSEPSYKLGVLAQKLGFTYKEHHALEDAAAAQYLFEYFNREYPVEVGAVGIYQYEKRLKETVDEKLTSNINDLHGIIAGITADGRIDEREISYLQNWIDDNSKYRSYSLFNRIITELNIILEDGIVTGYEQQKLLTIADSINHSKIYTDATLAVQILDGILKGIICDEAIETSEVESLKVWLSDNDYLAGVYPYDKILNIVTKTLEDGLITNEEKEELLSEFDDVLNPIKECEEIDLSGKFFCLTGDFVHGSRSEMEHLLEEKGGIKKTGVSTKLNYLFVGSLGSEAWKYGNAGGKIAKAQELQEKGNPIQIISEEDLFKSGC